jgi:hypothetical protein
MIVGGSNITVVPAQAPTIVSVLDQTSVLSIAESIAVVSVQRNLDVVSIAGTTVVPVQKTVTIVSGSGSTTGASGITFSATPPLNPALNDLWIMV